MISILHWLRKWFEAPPLTAERGAYRDRVIHFTLISTMVVMLLTISENLLNKDPNSITIVRYDLLVLAVLVLFRYWFMLGHKEAVTFWLFIFGFLGLTFGVVLQGSIHSSVIGVFFLMIVLAAIIYQGRGIILMVVSTSVAVLGLIMAEKYNLLQPITENLNYWEWFRYTAYFATVGGLSYYGMWVANQALEKSRKKTEELEALQDELRSLNRAVEQSPVSIIITDLESKIEYVNPTFTRVTGYTKEEVLGKNPRILNSGKTARSTYNDLWGTLTQGQEWRGEFLNRKKDGTIYNELAIISAIFNDEGKPTHYLAVKEDITERKQAELALQKANNNLTNSLAKVEKLQVLLRDMAIRDALTGLYNRHYLNETLEREFKRSERENKPLTFMIMDIDHFKKVNDTWGHPAGDAVLVALAELLRSSLRESDILCRLGGEEFLLVLPNLNQSDGLKLAETICKKCEEMPVYYEGQEMHVTVSIGMAIFPSHGNNFGEMLAAADKALYQSKHCGRNKVTVFEAPEPSPED